MCDVGPMVYGICYCPIEREKELKNLGVDGSLMRKSGLFALH